MSQLFAMQDNQNSLFPKFIQTSCWVYNKRNGAKKKGVNGPKSLFYHVVASEYLLRFPPA